MMARTSIVLVTALIPAFVVPVQGGIFFRRSPPRPNPTTRVPELLSIIRTDKDDRKRALAIEDLRSVDAKTYPEIVPVLVEALLKDQKPNVRLEAVQTLSRIRPISNAAAQALEQAAARDPSRWVRTQARSAVAQLRFANSGGKKEEGSVPADTKASQAATSANSASKSWAPANAASKIQTPKVVDRAGPKAESTPPVNAGVPRPLPANPVWSTAAPVAPGRTTPPPAAQGDGPVLAPPK